MAALLLCSFFSLAATQLAAAQGEEAPRPWWMNAMSITSSMIAIVCASIAAFEFGPKHRLFWGMQLLAWILAAIGLALPEVWGPFFWLALIYAILIVFLLVGLAVATLVVKGLISR